MKVLIIGDGLLGSELKKQNPEWGVLSRKQGNLDITNLSFISTIINYDVIINCIAHTDTYDTKRDKHWLVNYEWVQKLLEVCKLYNKKMVHISTDYVYANSVSNASEESVPVHHNSWYGYTKLLADGLVQLYGDKHLIVRCGHKPTPFPYDKAPNIMIGNFDYVDTISHLITKLVLTGRNGLFNVGTTLKSMYQLAKETKSDVIMTNLLPEPTMPTNVSMDVTKFFDYPHVDIIGLKMKHKKHD